MTTENMQMIMKKLNINTEPLILSSAEPINDGGRNLNKLYIFSIAICFIVFAITGANFLGICFSVVLGLIIGWIFKNKISELLILNARRTKFHLDNKIPYSELIHQLIPILSPLGAMIEKSEEGYPVISYQGEIYDVEYNDDDTFRIWWRRNIVKMYFMVDNITAYRKESVAMGIIGYHVQKICHNSLSPTDTKSLINDKVSVQNKPKKFCTKCGSPITLEAKFCKICGTKL